MAVKKQTTRKTAKKPDRRVRYQEHFTRTAEQYVARHGFDAAGLAAILGVCEDTVRTWAEERSNFKEAIRRGSDRFAAERPDAENIRKAEEALLTKVLGHPFEERKETTDKDGNVTETVTSGQIAPDVSAIKYYLKNRCPERWTDRQDVTVSGDGSVPLVVLVMDGEEIATNDTERPSAAIKSEH